MGDVSNCNEIVSCNVEPAYFPVTDQRIQIGPPINTQRERGSNSNRGNKYTVHPRRYPIRRQRSYAICGGLCFLEFPDYLNALEKRNATLYTFPTERVSHAGGQHSINDHVISAPRLCIHLSTCSRFLISSDCVAFHQTSRRSDLRQPVSPLGNCSWE